MGFRNFHFGCFLIENLCCIAYKRSNKLKCKILNNMYINTLFLIILQEGVESYWRW